MTDRDCDAVRTYVFRPVRRLPVRMGFWRGLHSAGGTLALFVDEHGRGVTLIDADLTLRCSDGSILGTGASFSPWKYGWVRPDGSFSHWVAEDVSGGGRQVVEMRGSFGGGRASGGLRVVAIDGPTATGPTTCDSGPLQFAVAWAAPPPRRP